MAKKPTRSKAPTKSSTPIPNPASDTGEAPTLSQVVRRKEFITRVAENSGMKRGQVRQVLDAALREMGQSLVRGEALNLPPLGKISINRAKETANADVVICKLRRSKSMDDAPRENSGENSGEKSGENSGEKTGETPLAEPAE